MTIDLSVSVGCVAVFALGAWMAVRPAFWADLAAQIRLRPSEPPRAGNVAFFRIAGPIVAFAGVAFFFVGVSGCVRVY